MTTTNSRVKRDKHPARSARIISTGIAIAATLGVSSALTIAAQAKSQTEQQTANTSTPDQTMPTVAAQSQAPSTPGSALPVATMPAAPAPTQATTQQTIAIQVPVAPQVWSPPATSGSH